MASPIEQLALVAFRQKLEALPETDIAWFAGWLSADGSIKPGGENWAPCVRFTITDRDPLDRFAALFGNKVYGPFKPHAGTLGSRPIFEWKLAGAKAVALVEKCLPWLSERYKQRALAAMQYEHIAHNGRKITPDNVSAIKLALSSGKHGIGRQLARQYGVTDGMISAIRRGRVWGYIPAR